MKKRQLKKILNLYVMDSDDDMLIPPSQYRPEERKMEKYFSKAWQISNPEEAKSFFEALEKARSESNCCCCHDDDCDCDGECNCNHDHEGCHCQEH